MRICGGLSRTWITPLLLSRTRFTDWQMTRHAMRILRMLSPTLLALVMCVGVTAGSMYVTVSTAVNKVTDVTVAGEDREAILTEADSVNARLEAVTVQLSDDGSLAGRVSGIDEVTGDLTAASHTTVTLLSSDGDQYEALSDAGGQFRFERIVPGLYTVNARGPAGSLSFGLRVVSADSPEVAFDASIPVSLNLQFDAALAPVRDYARLTELINSIHVDPVTSRADVMVNETALIPTSGGGGSATGSFLAHDQTLLDGDGSYSANIVLLDPETGSPVPVTDLKVYFIIDNEVVATTEVQPDGSFTQHNLLPGIYSMLVAGSDAIAYVAVDVTGGIAAADGEPTDAVLASASRRQPPSLGVIQGSSPIEDAPLAGDAPAPGSDDDDLGVPFFGDGGGGMFAGGGGGGLGGGGGWGLLLAGGLAAGIAAAVSDNNDTVIVSPKN